MLGATSLHISSPPWSEGPSSGLRTKLAISMSRQADVAISSKQTGKLIFLIQIYPKVSQFNYLLLNITCNSLQIDTIKGIWDFAGSLAGNYSSIIYGCSLLMHIALQYCSIIKSSNCHNQSRLDFPKHPLSSQLWLCVIYKYLQYRFYTNIILMEVIFGTTDQIPKIISLIESYVVIYLLCSTALVLKKNQPSYKPLGPQTLKNSKFYKKEINLS